MLNRITFKRNDQEFFFSVVGGQIDDFYLVSFQLLFSGMHPFSGGGELGILNEFKNRGFFPLQTHDVIIITDSNGSRYYQYNNINPFIPWMLVGNFVSDPLPFELEEVID